MKQINKIYILENKLLGIEVPKSIIIMDYTCLKQLASFSESFFLAETNSLPSQEGNPVHENNINLTNKKSQIKAVHNSNKK